jgi:putative redox protein
MDAKVTWAGGMTFDGVADSGFQVKMDTSVESGGSNSGVRPMELVLIALGGCTSMDVVPILKKKRQEVNAFEIRIHGDRAEEHPHVYTHITLEYVVTGHNIDQAAVERAIELSETKYCSVNAMLKKTANITTKVTLKEA